MRRRNLKYKVENACLNVCEQMEVVQRNKDGPLPSPAVPEIVSICEKKS